MEESELYDEDGKVLLVVPEAAKLKGVSKATIYEWISKGELDIVEKRKGRVGGRIYVVKNDRFVGRQSQKHGHGKKTSLEVVLKKLEETSIQQHERICALELKTHS